MAFLRETLDTLRRACQTAEDLVPHAYRGLPEHVKAYRGKVRDIVEEPESLVMVHSDRLTAFDRLIALVPYKGFILTQLTEWWFEQASRAGIAHHYLASPNSRSIKTLRLEPVKVEVVVRAYMAGSLLRAYEAGERVYCGAKLPEGLKPYGPLPEPIITPTTKAAAFEHDENSSPSDLIKSGVCTETEWDQIARGALRVFSWGSRLMHEKGSILADTKYEFGRTPAGKILLMDEIHTPDSSRFWNAVTYRSNLAAGQPPEMFDKENVRRFLLSKGFKGHGEVPGVPASVLLDLALTYLTFAEQVLGRPLETPTDFPSSG